jgi:predicted enzyme related to lactoylglutathione lyase
MNTLFFHSSVHGPPPAREPLKRTDHKVESSDSEILISKEEFPEMGRDYAVVADIEGNRVGLMFAE